MAYQALYRRLRPKHFDDVIGQDHIIRVLKNQIDSDKINHAYLFCGTRGTGKTSTAKIFARAVNCTGSNKPCNECECCKGIINGTSLNVAELDAASNNSVENIREIIEQVKYPPSTGRFKVYIIDEVHMLSVAAFNALLKTLEEPPEHVIFILATTDPQKIPVTVLSRCQRFDFHRISHDSMFNVLNEYCSSEGLNVSEDALNYITELSDGAMRDALSILEQCVSFYFDRQVQADDVRQITGAVDKGTLFSLTEAINNADSGRCMEIIDGITQQGKDLSQFSSDFALHLRNLLISITADKGVLDYSEEYISQLNKQASELGFHYLMTLTRQFAELPSKLKYASDERILLETECLRACYPVNTTMYGALLKRLSQLEKSVSEGSFSSVKTISDVLVPNEEKAPVIEIAVPEDYKSVIVRWKEFSDTCKGFMRNVIKNYVYPVYLDNNCVTFVCKANTYVDFCDNNMDDIKKKLEDFFKRKIEVSIMLEKEYNSKNIVNVDEKGERITLTKEMFSDLGDSAVFE